MASYTQLSQPFGLRRRLIPVGVLGHPIFNTNLHAFRLEPDSLGDAMFFTNQGQLREWVPPAEHV